MSTRYVWNRFSMSVSYSTGDGWEGIDNLNFADASGTITIKTASNPSNIRASFSGDSLETSNISIINAESSQTLYIGDDIDINADTIFEIYNSYGAKIRTGIQDETVKYSYFEKGTIHYYPAFKTYYPKATRSKGSRNGTVSNAASSTYPLNDNNLHVAIICAIFLTVVRRCKRVH